MSGGGDRMRVLRYLQETGSITPMEALDKFGCYRLGARIWELRQDGYEIRTEIVRDRDRHGEKCCYARYILEEERC